MQYKIPVQVENEDPIFLGLSLRQLGIIMVAFGIAYSTFQSLSVNLGGEVAIGISGFIGMLWVLIAIFKQYEMTFVPFVLSLLRFNINPKERLWDMGVDSFEPMDRGYILSQTTLEKEQDYTSKKDQIKTLAIN